MKKTSNIVIKLLFLVTLLLPWTVFSTEPVKAQSEKTIEIPFRLQCGNNQTIPVDTSAKVWLVFKSPIKDYEYIKEIPVSGGSAGGNMNYTFNPNEFFKGRLRYIDQPATGAFHLQASAIKDKDGEIHANNFSVQAVSVKYDWNQRTGKYEYTYLNNFNEEVIFNYPKCPVLAAPAAPVSESSDVQVDIGVNYLLQCQTSNSGFEIAPDQALATLKVTIGDQEYSMFELDGKNKKGLNQFAFNFKTEPNSKGWRGVWLGASALISADGKEVINPDTKQIQLGSIRVKDGNYSPLVPGKQAEFSYPRCPSSATSGTSQTTKGGVTVNKYMEEYKLNVSKPACEGTDTEISPRLPISAKQSYKDECKTKTNTCLDGWNNVINSNSDIFTLKGMKDFADNCLKTGVYSISNRITGEEVAASLSERCKDSFPPDKESNKNGECNSLAKSCIDRYVNSTLGSIWDKESLNKICLEVIKPKNNEQKPSDEDIKKEKDKSIDSCNRKELATDSQKISCKARVDVCFNENKKLTLDEIKKKCEEQGRQEGLTFEQKELDGWYTDQKRQQVGQICDKENLTDKQKTDCATATGQCFETKRSDYLSREPNVAGRLSKFAAIEKECISVGQKAISGADADGGGGSGGGGGGGGGGQPGGQQPGAQTAQTKKDPVKTEIVAHIHGQSSGTVSNIDTTQNKDAYYRVVVGARATPENSEACIEADEVSMAMEKVSELSGLAPKESDRKITITKQQGNGQKDDSLPEGKYQNCQSYWANLKGPGNYKLTVSYPGDEKHDPPYLASGDEIIEVQIIGSRAELPTKSTVKAESRGPSAVRGVFTKRISWTKLFGNTIKSNVAGVQVKDENGKLIVSPDKNSSNQLILTPQTTLADGTLDTAKIPTVHFTVTAVYKDGSTEQLVNNPNYPNGEPKVFSEADLNLDRLNHLEASTVFNRSDSEYAPSSGDLEIDVTNTKVEENPWVKLTSDPYKDNISATDNKVTITASTNYVAENPVFEVLHDGRNEDSRAVFSTTNCQDGQGSCEYGMELFQPKGEYKIKFSNKDASDSLEFKAEEPVIAEEKEEEEVEDEVVKIELLYKGEKKELSFDGGQIPFDLDPGNNTFQVIFHYKGKDEPVYKSFDVYYEEDAEEQSPSPDPSEEPSSAPDSSNEPDPSDDSSSQCTTVREYNECTGCNTSKHIVQDSCGNYEVTIESQQDSSCTDDCSTPAPDQTQDQDDNQDQGQSQDRIRWFCSGDMIKEQRNNNAPTDYEDCASQDKQCGAISTPGYESDAECY